MGMVSYYNVSFKLIAVTDHDVIACEGQTVSIECPADLVISTQQAFYGRQNDVTCPHDTAIRDLSCSDTAILDDVINLCDGHKNCTFDVMTHILGEPCPGTYKYLNFSYSCIRKYSFVRNSVCLDGLEDPLHTNLTTPSPTRLSISACFHLHSNVPTLVLW